MRMQNVLAVLVIATLGAPASALAATFVEPTAWSVGDLDTTFQQWTSGGTSASPITDNLVHTTNPAVSGSPVMTQTGAFIASSGGFYSFSGNYRVEATVPNHGTAGDGTWVLVQTAATVNPDYDPEGDLTGGSVLRDSIQIFDSIGNLLATSSPSDVTRTFYDANYPLFGGVGYEELLWEIYLPGYTGDFAVEFDEFVHSSLQALRIDSQIAPVPEPATIVLAASGLLTVAVVAVRRRRGA